MYKLILFLGICSASALGTKLSVSAEKCGKIIGCYYRPNFLGEYVGTLPALTDEIKNFNVHLCTHIIYNFVIIRANASVESVNTYSDQDYNAFKQFNDLRKMNQQLKTLVSMQGMCDESTFKINNKALTDPTLREKLVDNIVNFVKKHGFNGIDMDYSEPPQRGRRPSDKENFVLLLKALRERFDEENLILSVAVDPNEATAKILYDIEGIAAYVNFINLKTFDFHGDYDTDKKVGHTSPMYHSSDENAEECKRNIDYVVKYWISQLAPPSKLILGTSFSGVSYTLANTKLIGRGVPITKKQSKYDFDFGYNRICHLTKRWTYFYDEEQQVPYIYKGNQIIAYDDVHSIKVKAEYAKLMHLGGAMVSLIKDDDYAGHCGEKFALLKTLNRVLRNKC